MLAANICAADSGGMIYACNYLVDDGVTDNCSNWNAMLAAATNEATIVIPQVAHGYNVWTSCSNVAVISKTVHIEGTSRGVWPYSFAWVTMTNGSNQITIMAGATPVTTQYIVNKCFPYGTTVTGISGSTITLSANSTCNSPSYSIASITPSGGTWSVCPSSFTGSGGGGSGMSGTVSCSGGTISAMNINVPGNQYTSAPTVVLNGGTGSGTTFTVNLTAATQSNKVMWDGPAFTTPAPFANVQFSVATGVVGASIDNIGLDWTLNSTAVPGAAVLLGPTSGYDSGFTLRNSLIVGNTNDSSAEIHLFLTQGANNTNVLNNDFFNAFDCIAVRASQAKIAGNRTYGCYSDDVIIKASDNFTPPSAYNDANNNQISNHYDFGSGGIYLQSTCPACVSGSYNVMGNVVTGIVADQPRAAAVIEFPGTPSGVATNMEYNSFSAVNCSGGEDCVEMLPDTGNISNESYANIVGNGGDGAGFSTVASYGSGCATVSINGMNFANYGISNTRDLVPCITPPYVPGIVALLPNSSGYPGSQSASYLGPGYVDVFAATGSSIAQFWPGRFGTTVSSSTVSQCSGVQRLAWYLGTVSSMFDWSPNEIACLKSNGTSANLFITGSIQAGGGFLVNGCTSGASLATNSSNILTCSVPHGAIQGSLPLSALTTGTIVASQSLTYGGGAFSGFGAVLSNISCTTQPTLVFQNCVTSLSCASPTTIGTLSSTFVSGTVQSVSITGTNSVSGDIYQIVVGNTPVCASGTVSTYASY